MEAVKFIWTKDDTFDTIRDKLLLLIDRSVVNKEDSKSPVMIFTVSEIEESELTSIGHGFFKFLDGNLEYADGQGGYNFKGQKHKDMWCFKVDYGTKDSDGNQVSQSYSFMIPRTGNYEKDLHNCKIVIDDNHPFVFYER